MADRPQVPNWDNKNANKPEEYSSEFVVDNRRFANVTNASTGQRQLYLVSGLGGTPLTQRSLLSTTNADGTFTKGEEYDSFVNQFGLDTFKKADNTNKQQSTKLLSTPGVSTQSESEAIKNSKEFKSTSAGNNSGNSSNPEEKDPQNAADADAFKEELNAPEKEGTRKTYGNAIYPLDLSLEHQDCIKFSILRYRPSLASPTSGSNQNSSDINRAIIINDGVPTIEKAERLGTIVLPIPAGINDSNSVSWQENPLNEIQEKFGSASEQFIKTGSTEGGKTAVNSFSEAVKSGGVQSALSGLIAGAAVNAKSLQQRTSGTIFNNNLELLFNGPLLRSFSFTFKLSPRSEPEAKEVRKIIRFFKQAMSVKRSKTSLLLKTPHTFAISYLTSNKQHPYLNKFKECALTTVNVDYTPEGQYMTYMSADPDGRSMISYNLTLQFQELEPIFDDDYKNEDPVSNIGY